MDSEHKLWLGIWSLAAIALVAFMFFNYSYYKHEVDTVKELAEMGVNPVAIKCALQDDYGEFPVCVALAARSEP